VSTSAAELARLTGLPLAEVRGLLPDDGLVLREHVVALQRLLLRRELGLPPDDATEHADRGTASLGSSVVVGEVDQARGLFTGGAPLLDVFSREREVDRWSIAEVRTLLAKFGLGSEHVHRGADSLSPGERTRAALALLQARGVNLLVLDEPTNHLDLAAIEQLESALASYEGTLLLVTHDRRMRDAVTTTRHWRVDAGRVTEQDPAHRA